MVLRGLWQRKRLERRLLVNGVTAVFCGRSFPVFDLSLGGCRLLADDAELLQSKPMADHRRAMPVALGLSSLQSRFTVRPTSILVWQQSDAQGLGAIGLAFREIADLDALRLRWWIDLPEAERIGNAVEVTGRTSLEPR